MTQNFRYFIYYYYVYIKKKIIKAYWRGVYPNRLRHAENAAYDSLFETL